MNRTANDINIDTCNGTELMDIKIKKLNFLKKNINNDIN